MYATTTKLSCYTVACSHFVEKYNLSSLSSSSQGVPFFYAAASHFVEKYVGTGSARIRSFFAQARAKTPCICFLDELEAIGMRAGGGNSNAEYCQTVSQLLTELDGMHFRQRGAGTGAAGEHPWVFLAATNQYALVDPALLRPGRLDRIV